MNKRLPSEAGSVSLLLPRQSDDSLPACVTEICVLLSNLPSADTLQLTI